MKAELKRSGKNWIYLLDGNEVFTTNVRPRFKVLLEDGAEPYNIGCGYSECDQVLLRKLPYSHEKIWSFRNGREGEEYLVEILLAPKDCKLILNTSTGIARLVYNQKEMYLEEYNLHNYSDTYHNTVAHFNGYIKDAISLTLSGEVKTDREVVKKVKRNYRVFVKEWVAETFYLFKNLGVSCEVEKWS